MSTKGSTKTRDQADGRVADRPKNVRGRAMPRAGRASTTADTSGAFDIEAVKAQAREAVNDALHAASDLPSLQDAMTRVAQANLALHFQGDERAKLKNLRLTYENSLSADAYAEIGVEFEIEEPSVTASGKVVWLSVMGLFDGLPTITMWSNYGTDAVRFGVKNRGTITLKSNDLSHKPRFVMFELTLGQLRATDAAWTSIRDALVAQKQLMLSRDNSDEARAIRELDRMNREHEALKQAIEELEVKRSAARVAVGKLRHTLSNQISDQNDQPVLARLNTLRKQVGLDPLGPI